jgi:hypothetical protein
MDDHRHEIYDIYGTAATSADVEQLRNQVAGLREDLNIATERIRELEDRAYRAARGFSEVEE